MRFVGPKPRIRLGRALAGSFESGEGFCIFIFNLVRLDQSDLHIVRVFDGGVYNVQDRLRFKIVKTLARSLLSISQGRTIAGKLERNARTGRGRAEFVLKVSDIICFKNFGHARSY